MIDPKNCTDYKLNEQGLQEFLLFAIGVAGKNAATTARLLDDFLRALHLCYQGDHFAVIREAAVLFDLATFMGQMGFGCAKLKARGFIGVAHSDLNLRKCTVEQLEEIPGIGPKTSRFFLLHTRPKARIACLDRHILRFLSEEGYDVPPHTPQSKKQYARIEQSFLREADKRNVGVAEFDLALWNRYAKHSK